MEATAGSDEHYKAPALPRDELLNQERRLSLQSSQEVILAFMATIATLDDAPVPLLAVPFVLLLILALFNRPSSDFLASLKEHVRLPRTVMVRLTSGASSKLYSAPLISILFVPREKLISLRRPGGHGEIYHELGHRRQFDMAAILWLVLAGILWFGLFLTHLPQGISEIIDLLWFGQPSDGSEHIPLLKPGQEFYPALMMLVMAVIVFTSLQRLLHNREYLADIRGALADEEALLAFLSEGVDEESFRSTTQTRWVRWSI